MSDSAIHAVQGVSQRVRELGRRATQLSTRRDLLQSDLDAKQSEFTELGIQVETLTKVSELYSKLMDLLVDRQVRVVEDIVTEGIQSIFSGLDLSFEADVSTKSGKVSVDFFFRQGPKSDPLSPRGDPLDSFGGGPTSVASLILRIITVKRLNRFPVLFLDETLSAVSEAFVDDTGQFLTSLANRLGVDVLLVTHQPRFLEHANLAYRCSEVVQGDNRSIELKALK